MGKESIKIKVLIVEDEPNYADTLEMYLDELGYEIAGIADEGNKALALFEKENPDVLLLDIHIKGSMTGIDVAKKAQKHQPTPIIFITSFDDPETFARAKETVPFDYIVKPFDEATLQRSIELAIATAHSKRQESADNQQGVVATDSFFLKDKNRLFKLIKNDIEYVEVDDKYCRIIAEDRKYFIRQSLSEMIQNLDSNEFLQIHRSYLINRNKVSFIDTKDNFVQINDQQLPIGRAYKTHLLERLNIL